MWDCNKFLWGLKDGNFHLTAMKGDGYGQSVEWRCGKRADRIGSNPPGGILVIREYRSMVTSIGAKHICRVVLWAILFGLGPRTGLRG